MNALVYLSVQRASGAGAETAYQHKPLQSQVLGEDLTVVMGLGLAGPRVLGWS